MRLGLGTSPKKLGLSMMVAGPAMGLVYLAGLVVYRTLTLQVTAGALMVLFAGIVTWIGYTMFTEPATARPIASEAELDDLAPETVAPRPGAGSRFSSVVDCVIGEGTVIRDQVNLYKCKIGKNCKIESFVYIEEGVVIGDRCKIKPNVFIPTGVRMEDDVFIGPNATFTNDKYPRSAGDWKLLETWIGKGASIGAHAVILPGVRVGSNSIVGAGAVVTKDVPEGSVALGNPARILTMSTVRERGL